MGYDYFEKKIKLEELATIEGKTSYDDMIKCVIDIDKKIIAVNAGMHPALAYPIEKITIYCNKDFNAKHLAGEPLDDIVKLNYYSYYSFIQNGYRPHTQNEQHLQDVEGYSLPLDCVTKDLTKLISLKRGLTTMEFSSAPAVPGEYNFVLETTINGKVFKSEFAYTFE